MNKFQFFYRQTSVKRAHAYINADRHTKKNNAVGISFTIFVEQKSLLAFHHSKLELYERCKIGKRVEVENSNNAAFYSSRIVILQYTSNSCSEW